MAQRQRGAAAPERGYALCVERSGSAGGRGNVVYLPGFRFEPNSGRLWRSDTEVALRAKTAAVLSVLVAHPDQVVSRRELLDAVWPEGFVGDAALSGCVNELRRLFDDNPAHPRFVATAHRRGYRLIAEVTTSPPRVVPPRLFVGRESELATLESWWSDASAGGPRVGFVTGAAGTGKTAVVDRFMSGPECLVGWGQCVEQFGAGEAYLPVLQAWGGLARGPGAGLVLEVLRDCAPSWLAQLPGLDSAESDRGEAFRGVSAARMMREFAVAVETLSAKRPLLLVLEDLHEADRPTAELIGYVARRREVARLLIVGTYRPAQVIAREHPLVQVVAELRSRRLCRQLTLELLSVDEVAEYLSARLAPRLPSPELIADVYQRTEGNALFVVAVTDFLIGHDLLIDDAEHVGVRARDRLALLGVPDTVRDMLERQVDALDDTDRRLLTVAAAVGSEFTVEAVRAGLAGQASVSAAHVEERCARIAGAHALLRPAGEAQWPDGTLTGRYRFAHEMYREVFYERLGPARRAEVHHGIAARVAAGFASSPVQVAGELGMHYERGRDYPAAANQLILAATGALGRSSYPEALAHTTKVLGMLDRVPEPAERSRVELAARRVQTVAAAATWGWREPRYYEGCLRLRALAVENGDDRALLTAVVGLHNAAMMDGDGDAMLRYVQEVDALVERDPDPVVRLVDDLLHMRSDSRNGRHALIRERAERMLRTYRPSEHRQLALLVGEEFDVAAHLYGAVALWHLGYPDQARLHAAAALEEARAQEIPAGLARALWFAATVYLLCGEAERVRELAEELQAISVKHELPLWRAGSAIIAGWAAATLGDLGGGLARIQDGMERWMSLAGIGDTLFRCLMAEICLVAGEVGAGLDAVQSGLDAIERTGYLQGEPELLRLRGELLLAGAEASGEADRPTTTAYAEQALERAYRVAAGRPERSFQLRAATSLARRWRETGRNGEARALLSKVYAWFTEGQDTRDLALARDLLESLSEQAPLELP